MWCELHVLGAPLCCREWCSACELQAADQTHLCVSALDPRRNKSQRARQADDARLLLHTGLWPAQLAAWALLVGSAFAMPNAVVLGYGQVPPHASPTLSLQHPSPTLSSENRLGRARTQQPYPTLTLCTDAALPRRAAGARAGRRVPGAAGAAAAGLRVCDLRVAHRPARAAAHGRAHSGARSRAAAVHMSHAVICAAPAPHAPGRATSSMSCSLL